MPTPAVAGTTPTPAAGDADADDAFPNGVAAGDVDQTSAILWARAASPGLITFEYCEKPNELDELEVTDFSGCDDNAIIKDVKDSLIPAKVKISGLKPGTLYQYRVCNGEFCPDSGSHTLIDIKPGSYPNSVNPKSKGVIPVAVLSSIDFDAMQVIVSTVTFGPDGASPAHNGHVEDVNDDGFMDLMFHFRTQETGIVCGDTEATLNGELLDQTPITGTDSVNTVGCNGKRAKNEESTSAEIEEKRGQFRTPFADGHNGLSFGVSSCWKQSERPFHSIKNIPERNLDFFVALGDTAYMDTNGINPKTRTEFREEYIRTYGLLDPDLTDNFFKDARAKTAFYVNIDDHEIVNNFQGGANPRSQQVSVSCLDEKQQRCFCDPSNDPNGNCGRPYINETDLYLDGLKAWQEYNPVDQSIKYGITGDPRTAGKDKLYRYRTFGKDAAIFMLDSRSFRDHPVAISVIDILPATAWGAGRTMLGEAQLNELRSNLVDAQSRGITWKFVLVPEPIQNMSKLGAGDRFEGYAYERALVLEHIRENCITNVVFISGDIHGTLANNLVYKKNFLDNKIYSSTWDISTGPAGHGDPIGPNTMGFLGYWDQDTRDQKNEFFEDWINEALLINRSPYIGLNDEEPYGFIRDQQNAYVPVRNPPEGEAGYSSTNTNGWTEFNIHEETQLLTVTTWGIEREQNEGDDGPPTKLIGSIPTKMSQFTVEARSESDISCGVGKPNGSACALDSACASGSCYLLACRAKGSVGERCLQDTDCLSGFCSNEVIGLYRLCEAKKEVGETCRYDADCRSGYCTDSVLPGNRVCEVKKEVGETCRYDTDCISEYCTDSVLPGNRFCEVKKEVGETCRYDTDCISEYCTDSVLPGNRVCELKKGRGETCRYDTDCLSQYYCTNETLPANRTCQDKKESGESCRFDSDCRFNQCRGALFKTCR